MLCRLPSLLAFFIFAGLLTACDEQSAPLQRVDKSETFVIAVNGPLHYFATRLLDNDIKVRMLVPADTDPAQWQPSVEDVLQLQQAELILLNGAGYSSWLNKVSVIDSRLVLTSGAARDEWIELEGQLSHSHGPDGEHAHGGYAFTTWMDMNLAQIQATAVAKALRARWPEKQALIDGKLVALLADIVDLDNGYMAAATRIQNRQLVYSHPVYQYFERRYELPGLSLHWEPDLMPGDAQWSELQRLTSEDILFIWEAEPAVEITGRMSALGIEWVVLDPAANLAENDWLAVQKKNVARLQQRE